MICTICLSEKHRASSCPHRIIEAPAALIAICFLAILTLTSCAKEDPQTRSSSITIINDTYCQIAKEESWSVEDTPETADGIRKRNAGYAKACKEQPNGK